MSAAEITCEECGAAMPEGVAEHQEQGCQQPGEDLVLAWAAARGAHVVTIEKGSK